MIWRRFPATVIDWKPNLRLPQARTDLIATRLRVCGALTSHSLFDEGFPRHYRLSHFAPFSGSHRASGNCITHSSVKYFVSQRKRTNSVRRPCFSPMSARGNPVRLLPGFFTVYFSATVAVTLLTHTIIIPFTGL